MTARWLVLAAAAASFCLPDHASAQSPRAERGKTFARVNCARCHSIDKVSPSPLAIAPPFRTLHERYSVEALEEALAEGIVTGHANMPEFRLEPDQIGNLIAFLKTLER
jgi:mono/diheme cytochrome c family protein